MPLRIKRRKKGREARMQRRGRRIKEPEWQLRLAAAGVDLGKPRPATQAEREAIWEDLEQVGQTKAAGYLPRHTVRNFCGKTIEQATHVLTARGLSVRIVSEDECPIASGALFAFDRSMAEAVIARHADILGQKNWPADVDQVMSKISQVWFAPDDPAMPLIRDLYNDA
jgi:hypothetical protein